MAERDPLEGQIERLREQAEELLLLAAARAEAGHGPISEKLTEVAAELEAKARRLQGGGAPGARRPQVQEFRLRAEELQTIAASLHNRDAQEGLLRAAESCERIAASLERTSRTRP